MNILKYVPKGATIQASRALLQVQKSSPTTLFVAGAVGVVATAVLAGRATLKAAAIVEETVDGNESYDNVPLTNKEKAALAGKIVKVYAPTVAVGVLTVGALTGSHRILTARNTSLTAAYAALTDVYEKYQERVASEIGSDKEQAIRQDLAKKTFDEDGKSVKYKAAGPAQVSPYARFFDESCSSYTRSAEQNLLFLHCQQDYANNRLRARGHVFLNEIYDSLGFPRTAAGAIVGWVIGDGDNFIDFGLYNEASEAARAFINGHERAVFLDFNVDGVIYKLIEK